MAKTEIKCDTKADQTQSLAMNVGEWCKRCESDFMTAEDDLLTKRCIECGIIHLQGRCFEKLQGWMCLGCASEYDQALLKQMVPTEAE